MKSLLRELTTLVQKDGRLYLLGKRAVGSKVMCDLQFYVGESNENLNIFFFLDRNLVNTKGTQ